MRKVIIIKRSNAKPSFPDGVLCTLPIDQFPVHESNLNAFGFPYNDIAILRELSAKGGLNNQKFEVAASRLNVIREHDNSKKTLEELWQDWRPSWYQSPTELVQFEKWYLEKYPFEQDNNVNTDADTKVEKPVETPVESPE